MNAMVNEPQADLNTAVGQTTDAALMKIVTLLDSLSIRPGALQSVLDNALPRLRQLRPARPLRMARLLFVPVEGIIVPGTAWKSGDATLPRPALPAIAQAIEKAVGPRTLALSATLARLAPTAVGPIGTLGAMLWSEAADRAARCTVAPEEGYTAADMQAFLALCAAGWRHGAAVWAIVGHAPDLPQPAQLRSLLTQASADPVALRIVLATLFYRSARPGSVAAMGRDISPAVTKAIEGALDRRIESSITPADLATPELAAELDSRLAAMADDLKESGWLGSKARRTRLDAVRAKVERARTGDADGTGAAGGEGRARKPPAAPRGLINGEDARRYRRRLRESVTPPRV